MLPVRTTPTVSHLGLQVTGFTARRAIVNAVFAEAHVMEALAKRAVFVTGAASLRLVTEHAGKIFGHSGRLARFGWSATGRWSMNQRVHRQGGKETDSGENSLKLHGKGCIPGMFTDLRRRFPSVRAAFAQDDRVKHVWLLSGISPAVSLVLYATDHMEQWEI